MMIRNRNKWIGSLLGVTALIALSSCSAQKDLIATQASNIDSLQTSMQQLVAERDNLLQYNEELLKENDRMQEQIAVLRANIEAQDELLEDKTDKAELVEEWQQETEAIVATFKDYGIDVMVEEGMIRLSVDEGLLFESGSAKINNRGQMLVDRIAEGIMQMRHAEIIVEGHTDSDPLIGPENNWDLSVERSMAVVERMIREHDVSAQKLMVAGKSKFDPVAKNTSEAMKALNRRVEFIIVPNVETLLQEVE
ncbi:OmpA family protein [Roseivirga sp. UBA838]|nr:OmpA family protein [Roseivirga sp. UBA838]|tara:strand:- start:9347 stop:10102 length:756 start_codon:yes stop_codon:yes gene_type:complete